MAGGKTKKQADAMLPAAFEPGLVRATEAAAIAAADLIGRGDGVAADRAAVEAMRAHLNRIEMRGQVVIGEGERDKAPMLFIGEKAGTGKGIKTDIAVDPLEGTALTARAMNNALTVAVLAPGGDLLHAPDVYMEKIAVGSGLPKGVVGLDRPAEANIRALARARRLPASRIAACILDRPRHAGIIAGVRKAGAAVHLITDGDIAGVMHVADPDSGIDIYMGTGGAPEGVIAAAALRCLGGQMFARLQLPGEEQKKRARKMGARPGKIYAIPDMVRSDRVIFAATGVTPGSLLDGVRFGPGGAAQTHSLLLTGAPREMRLIRRRILGGKQA